MTDQNRKRDISEINDVTDTPIVKRRKIDNDSIQIQEQNTKKLEKCLKDFINSKKEKLTVSDLRTFYNSLKNILPMIVNKKSKIDIINGHYMTSCINLADPYMSILGYLNAMIYPTQKPKSRFITFINIFKLLLKNGFFPMNRYKIPIKDYYIEKKDKYILSEEAWNSMKLKYDYISRIFIDYQKLELLDIIVKYTDYKHFDLIQPAILSMNLNKAVRSVCFAEAFYCLGNSEEKIKLLIDSNICPLFTIFDYKGSVWISYEQIIKCQFYGDLRINYLVKKMNDVINDKNAYYFVKECICILLIWKYYERTIKQSLLNCYNENMIISKDIYKFITNNYILENLSHLKNRIDYKKWINCCLICIVGYSARSFQKWFNDEMIEKNMNKYENQILIESIIENKDIIIDPEKYWMCLDLLASFVKIYNENATKPLDTKVIFKIIKYGLSDKCYKLFKNGFKCLSDTQIQTQKIWKDLFAKIWTNDWYKPNNDSDSEEEFDSSMNGDIVNKYIGKYLNDLLIENNSNNSIINEIFNIFKLIDENGLNHLLISAAIFKQENLFILLINSKYMENDKSDESELRDIFYIRKKGTKDMKKVFCKWTGINE